MMLPPGPLSLAAGDSSVAASSVRPIGITSTLDALIVVATVAVVAVSLAPAVTLTTSVNPPTASLTLTGNRSAILRLTALLVVAKPWRSKVSVYSPAGRNGTM